MIRINDISLPLDYDAETLRKAAAGKLSVRVAAAAVRDLAARRHGRKRHPGCSALIFGL